MKNLRSFDFAVTLAFLFSLAANLVPTTSQASMESASVEIESSITSTDQVAWLRSEVQTWTHVFPVPDVFSKVVDNYGDGDLSIYGTRNFREVLSGVYYRGGANNAFLKPTRRDNMNPLPNVGLQNLCQKGFSEAYYFYPTNYRTAPPVINCKLPSGESHQLKYQQATALEAATPRLILSRIFQRIKGQLPGPIYGHCWNGWHASGLIAALALEQFCKWSPQKAYAYWVQNTDSHSSGYSAIRSEIINYKRFSEFEISNEEAQLICPR